MSATTYVVHVTVKMDAHTERQAVTDALDAIDSALTSNLGGERNSWHPYEKSNGHVVRAISVEGANIAGARIGAPGKMNLVTISNDDGVLFRVLANDGRVTQLQDAALRADLAMSTTRRFSTVEETLEALAGMAL